MSATKRQVAECQAAGMTPQAIAMRLGISESYISQLQNDVSFQKVLHELTGAGALAQLSSHARIDHCYNNLEETFAQLLVDNKDVVLPTMIQKPSTMMSFMRTLNSMKRRSAGETLNQQPQGNGAVVLELPSFITQQADVKVQHNELNEVVQVQDTALVAMDSENLNKMADSHSAEAIRKLRASSEVLPEPDKLDLAL